MPFAACREAIEEHRFTIYNLLDADLESASPVLAEKL
jgi:hypothetical protein